MSTETIQPIRRPEDAHEAVRLLAAGYTVEIPENRRLETLMWMQQEGHPRPSSVVTMGEWCQLRG